MKSGNLGACFWLIRWYQTHSLYLHSSKALIIIIDNLSGSKRLPSINKTTLDKYGRENVQTVCNLLR